MYFIRDACPGGGGTINTSSPAYSLEYTRGVFVFSNEKKEINNSCIMFNEIIYDFHLSYCTARMPPTRIYRIVEHNIPPGYDARPITVPEPRAAATRLPMRCGIKSDFLCSTRTTHAAHALSFVHQSRDASRSLGKINDNII